MECLGAILVVWFDLFYLFDLLFDIWFAYFPFDFAGCWLVGYGDIPTLWLDLID